MDTNNNKHNNTKFRKWKFATNRKIFITEKRLARWIEKGDLSIYDTRDIDIYKRDNLENSINISPILIKPKVLEHDINDKIILMGNNLRTNATIASWARYKGYKRIYLVDEAVSKAFSIEK